jgi:hypothetical protein
VALPADARSLRDQLPAAARGVGIEGGAAFDALAGAIADTAARSIPTMAASAGFTYRYNPQIEVFERTSETLGPIFMERPDTLGRGKLNVNVSIQYVQLDEFDGTPTSELENADPIITRFVDNTGAAGFSASRLRYGFKLINHVTAVSVTYGVLDDLDVNLLIPVIETDFDATAYRQQVAAAGADGVFSPQPGGLRTGPTHGNKLGVGDILLRGKYKLPRWEWFRSAVGLQLRLPSGDEDNFQGTGSFEASPFLYLSTVVWGRVEPHASVGFDLRADDVARSEVRYDLGTDIDVTKRIGLALAFLSRSEFARSAPAGSTSFLHLTSAGPAERPLLGVDFGRKDYYDFSFGARAVVWRQVMLFANGIYPIDDSGLRSSGIIPTIGVEGTF